MASEPSVTYLQDMYRFNYAVEGIEVSVERLSQGSHDELYAEVTTVTSVEPNAGLLHQAKLNLTSSRTRADYVRQLASRAIPGFLDTVDFQLIIEQVCYLTRKRWREGEPVINLAAYEPAGVSPYLLRPFLLDRAPTIIFGFGESGKSLVAMGIGVSVAANKNVLGVMPEYSGNVLYLDWEWDPDNHRRRLEAICNGIMLDIRSLDGKILYRNQYASLPDSAAAIRKIIMEHHIVLVIIDSMGGARGGEVKESKLTLDAYAAIRTFGVATLVIDHLAKDDEDKNSHKSPIGSVYSTNSARLMWRLDGAYTANANQKELKMTNTKANGKHQFDRAFTMTIESDEDDNPTLIGWEARDARTMSSFIKDMALRDQIRVVLDEERRMMHEREIVASLKSQGVVRTAAEVLAALNRYHQKHKGRGVAFVDVVDQAGIRVWGVASERDTESYV